MIVIFVDFIFENIFFFLAVDQKPLDGNTTKTSKAEITLKSATLPRRKTVKAEIQLDIKPKVRSLQKNIKSCTVVKKIPSNCHVTTSFTVGKSNEILYRNAAQYARFT
jgi:hypothetical protein